jgi:hypothetical protein
MLLFVLGSIPLIKMIENEDKIIGYKTRGENNMKILSYADDTTIIITDPKAYDKIFEIYNKHAIASEAKINPEKTEVLLIGDWVGRGLGKNLNKKVKPQVKILGNIFATDPDKNSEYNWEKALDKMVQKMPAIKNRKVSLIGKVLLVNSLMLSQIWHLAWLLQENKEYIKKVYRLCNTAINGNESSRNVIDKVILSKEKGGLNLANINNKLIAFKVKQLEVFVKNTLCKEHDELKYYLGTRVHKMIGPHCGPKKEFNKNKYEKYLKILDKNFDSLKRKNTKKGEDKRN